MHSMYKIVEVLYSGWNSLGKKYSRGEGNMSVKVSTLEKQKLKNKSANWSFVAKKVLPKYIPNLSNKF